MDKVQKLTFLAHFVSLHCSLLVF